MWRALTRIRQPITQALLERSLELVRTADAVILSDYAKGALSAELCQAVIALAREQRIPVLVDPKGLDFSKYAGATTICPNLQELALVTGIAAVTWPNCLPRRKSRWVNWASTT